MATSEEEKSFTDLVPHLKLLRVITLGDLIKLQYTRDKYPNLSLSDLFSQLIDIVYEVVEELSFRFEQEKLLTPFIKPLKPLFEQVSALTYLNLNPFREDFVPIFREKMFNKKEFLKELSCIEPTLKRIGQGAFVTSWFLTKGSATFFKNQKSTFCSVCKSLQHFKKILIVLERVLNCLVFSHAVLEKKILRKKVVIPSESTEEQIQELVPIFDNQFIPIYENCQAYHRELFKKLPLEIDCLILKIYVSTSQSLGATAADSEQNCLLFQEAKELGLIYRTCKVGEWPYSKLIDFREGVEPYQEVKEKVLAKKWTNISLEESNEKFKCDCDACSFRKPYACQQPLMKRHQLVENPFFLKFQK
jgi:hypothetical protein